MRISYTSQISSMSWFLHLEFDFTFQNQKFGTNRNAGLNHKSRIWIRYKTELQIDLIWNMFCRRVPQWNPFKYHFPDAWLMPLKSGNIRPICHLITRSRWDLFYRILRDAIEKHLHNFLNKYVLDLNLPWPIFDLTVLEGELDFLLTKIYHNFSGAFQSGYMFTLSAKREATRYLVFIDNIWSLGSLAISWR